MIKAFDEVFANTVVQRTSIFLPKLFMELNFYRCITLPKINKTTILDLDKINFTKKFQLIISECCI
jgi:hypothetical protein